MMRWTTSLSLQPNNKSVQFCLQHSKSTKQPQYSRDKGLTFSFLAHSWIPEPHTGLLCIDAYPHPRSPFWMWVEPDNLITTISWITVICPKIDMEVFSSDEPRSEHATLACRSSSDLAMATHTHRDFRMEALLSDLPSASTGEQHLPSSENGKGEHHRRAYSQRVSGRSRLSTGSKKREEYDPELEKLVRERVYDLHVRVQSVQAHEQQALSTNERESPAAPAVPPRTSRVGRNSNHSNSPGRESKPLPPTPPEASTSGSSAKTCACGNCFGSLNGVCQQCSSSGLVIGGDHDYINQDHLDAILEEQEEVDSKRKRQDSEDSEDFMDEATADVVLNQAKDRRGNHPTYRELF